MYARVTAALLILVLILATHWKAYVAGKQSVAAQYQAAALAASEAARKREHELTAKVEGLDRDLQKQKARNAALDRAHAERLREYQAALGRAAETPAAPRGADATFARIAGECGAALAALDQHDRELARIAAGLQRYTTEVCLAPR